jgi:hypothetical protein
VYHGGGGFIHSEVYNMPIWMRQLHIRAIHQFLDEREQEAEKQRNKHKTSSQGKVKGPGIKPSSTYNFKK